MTSRRVNEHRVKRHRGLRPTLALFAYFLVGVLCAVLVVNTLRVPIGWGAREYSAEFSDVGGLGPGSEVTVAGVRVGRVLGVEREVGPGGDIIAVVDFEVQRASPVTRGARASVRYGDMLGIRYLSLDPAQDGGPAVGGADTPPGVRLPEDSRIPLGATTDPVDLTALVNGFKPLFEAVRPEEVNTLSTTVVAAFQGEPGAMDVLLARLALLSRDVIQKEDVYSRLADNIVALNTTLTNREEDLQRLLNGLDTVSAALAEDGGNDLALLIERGDASTATLASMLRETEPDLRASVDATRLTTDGWIPNTPAFDTALGKAPLFAREVNAQAQKGGFLSLYMCNFTVKWDDWETSLFGYRNSEVCR
ncbi:MCE family protein [Rhodococcus sp. IEGM 1408]|uniref:MCE family protein n=1 Tax=Rhodococcus sp. IEGM 1408 TaxID=3082220 RepID=UPI002955875C|nr:MCE family protein [Rhodococcus sp. IEGM 1408]MDV8000020.1 MCE family protein [Rhodococcus sp. IEGM 1408]